MKSRLFLAIFMNCSLLAGGALTHAATTMNAGGVDNRMSYQSTVNTGGSQKSKRKSRVKKAAADLDNGTKDLGEDVGKGGEKAGEVTARGTGEGAKDLAIAGKDVTKDTTKGVKDAGKATSKGVKKAVKKL